MPMKPLKTTAVRDYGSELLIEQFRAEQDFVKDKAECVDIAREVRRRRVPMSLIEDFGRIVAWLADRDRSAGRRRCSNLDIDFAVRTDRDVRGRERRVIELMIVNVRERVRDL